MSISPKILLISNQQVTLPLGLTSFTPQRLQIVMERHLAKVMQRWGEETPDIIVFDSDGMEAISFELIRKLREQAVIPILWLSSNQTVKTMLEAYDAGVDEYVFKPIHPALLQAKVRAWLRRSLSIPADMLDSLNLGNVRLVPADRTIVFGSSKPVRLTNLEMRVMFYLMSHMDRPVMTEELCQRVWGTEAEGNKTGLKNVIYRLRQKVEADPDQPQYIKTMPGVGYQFNVK